jgi:hypothetical protein
MLSSVIFSFTLAPVAGLPLIVNVLDFLSEKIWRRMTMFELFPLPLSSSSMKPSFCWSLTKAEISVARPRTWENVSHGMSCSY